MRPSWKCKSGPNHDKRHHAHSREAIICESTQWAAFQRTTFLACAWWRFKCRLVDWASNTNNTQQSELNPNRKKFLTVTRRPPGAMSTSAAVGVAMLAWLIAAALHRKSGDHPGTHLTHRSTTRPLVSAVCAGMAWDLTCLAHWAIY